MWNTFSVLISNLVINNEFILCPESSGLQIVLINIIIDSLSKTHIH